MTTTHTERRDLPLRAYVDAQRAIDLEYRAALAAADEAWRALQMKLAPDDAPTAGDYAAWRMTKDEAHVVAALARPRAHQDYRQAVADERTATFIDYLTDPYDEAPDPMARADELVAGFMGYLDGIVRAPDFAAADEDRKVTR